MMRRRCAERNAPHSPSPAMRERVASAASRVRVPQHFIYRQPVASPNGRRKSSQAPGVFDRRRATDVVGSPRSTFAEIQVSPATPNWASRCGLRMHPAPGRGRGGRRSPWGKRCGLATNRLARKPGLAGHPLLEQRRSQQYQRSDRSDPAGVAGPVSPHPPSASRWVPPSPAVRARGFAQRL
jgi:hypothetical protein